jgi:carboxylate-amine ligase
MSRPTFTLGIEEEYQIVHPETRELTSYIQEFLDAGRVILKDQIKPEFLQSQVEVGSRVCSSLKEARSEIVRLRREVIRMAEQRGLRVAAAGTHPFTSWTTQQVTAGERYTKHEQNMADIARQMLVFGMHVHIGIENRELLVDLMNQLRYFLPHLLALSTSSPFWQGRDTGLKSFRTIILGNLPRAGMPPSFGSWAEYDHFVETLVRTGCIDEPSKIWWDMRPSHKYPTLEIRIPDICTRVDEVMCIAGLLIALTSKLIKLRASNISWRSYRRNLVAENKWRAVRYGIHGKLIDFGRREEVSFRELMGEMLELVDDVLDELDIRSDVHYVHRIFEEGTSADRQLEVYRKSGDMRAVVDHVIAETRAGLDLD